MIDLHCHILPPIDVAAGISALLEMARASVVDGVTALACTHILAGLSNNSGPQIPQAAQLLQLALEREQIPLLLVGVVVAGHVLILTPPEPLTGIKSHYPLIHRFVSIGVWMHITAGSVTGAFGRAAQYWAEKMLDEDLVHILEPDAHGVRRRPPNLSEGYERAASDLAFQRQGTWF
jgi:protein-tyrosine phosphatase